VAVSVLVFAGRPALRPHSAFFDHFDPVALFDRYPGYSVEGVTGSGTFHMSRGAAFREWRGFVKSADADLIPAMAQHAIDEYLWSSDSHTLVIGDLTAHAREQPLAVQVPSHGLFLFNQGGRHGELHVWLFPDSSGTGVGYAISLHEEPLD
jgi:hypothetical protein